VGSVPRSAAGAPGAAAGVGRVGRRGVGGGGGRAALGARDARGADEFSTVNDGGCGELVDIGGHDDVNVDIEHHDHFNHDDFNHVDVGAGADVGAGCRGDDDRADSWDDQAADSDNTATGSCHDVTTCVGVDEVVHVFGDGCTVLRAVLGHGVSAGCVAGGGVRAVGSGRVGYDERVGVGRLWDVAGGDHGTGRRVRVVVVGELEIEREQRKS
jgi:hypothetical protein